MEKIKPQANDALFSGFSANSKQLALHKDSHIISKLKPKIRIIHLVAPEVIKTDVENFRDLVQRLTGKSTEAKERIKKGRGGLPTKGMISSSSNCPKLWTDVQLRRQANQGIQLLQGTPKIEKQMEYLHKGEGTAQGIFGCFGDMDMNMVQDLSQFPLLPLKPSQSQINNMFSEMPLC